MAMFVTVLLRTNAGVWIGILLVSAIIIGAAVAVGVKKRNELLGQGKIVQRPYNFYDMAEIFTLGPVAPQAIATVLSRSQNFAQMGVQVTSDLANNQVIFRQGRWVGLLRFMGYNGDPAQGGKTVYRLWITSYETYRSSVQGTLEMNEMMTEVEKVLLGFDPNTQVSTEMVTRKTHTKFF